MLRCYSPSPNLANNMRLTRLTLRVAVCRGSYNGVINAVTMDGNQFVGVASRVAGTSSAR